MATVHLGRLLGPVGFSRTVAIKRLHAQFASDPEFVSMFLDEARLAARIRHPNVVPTLDVVATGGELFLVMDYVQGESLSKLIRAARERKERVPVKFSRRRSMGGGAPSVLHAGRTKRRTSAASLCASFTATSHRKIFWSAPTASRACSISASRKPRAACRRRAKVSSKASSRTWRRSKLADRSRAKRTSTRRRSFCGKP